MASRLSEWLRRDGTLSAQALRAAEGRQAVYGGALDTALLELEAADEPTLWTALAEATGIPVPEAALFENPDTGAAGAFDAAWSRRCRAVPVAARDEGTLLLLCSELYDLPGLEAAQSALGLTFELYVVPEVRLAAARQVVYGEIMPPRLLRLLARLVGAQPVRRWVESLAPRRAGGAPATAPPGDSGRGQDGAPAPVEFDVSVPSFSPSTATPVGRAPAASLAGLDARGASAVGALGGATIEDPPGAIDDRLCRIAEDPAAEARLPALKVLRTRLRSPRVQELAAKLRADLAGPPEVAVLAASSLTELRDPAAVPALIEALQGPPALAQTAQQALIEITKQDYGQSRRRWVAWWERHQGEDRTDWLFDGLAHKAPEVRFSASEELRLLTGEYFGYHFDLPKREREEARARWQSWWVEARQARR